MREAPGSVPVRAPPVRYPMLLLRDQLQATLGNGFTLVYRVAGVLNLAQGAFVVLGALVFYALEVGASWPLPLAIAGAVAILAAVGAVVEWVVVHRALGRLSTAGILILTVGLLTFFEGATLLIWAASPTRCRRSSARRRSSLAASASRRRPSRSSRPRESS